MRTAREERVRAPGERENKGDRRDRERYRRRETRGKRERENMSINRAYICFIGILKPTPEQTHESKYSVAVGCNINHSHYNKTANDDYIPDPPTRF